MTELCLKYNILFNKLILTEQFKTYLAESKLTEYKITPEILIKALNEEPIEKTSPYCPKKSSALFNAMPPSVQNQHLSFCPSTSRGGCTKHWNDVMKSLAVSIVIEWLKTSPPHLNGRNNNEIHA